MEVRRNGEFIEGENGLRVKDAAYPEEVVRALMLQCRGLASEYREMAAKQDFVADFYQAILRLRKSEAPAGASTEGSRDG